MNTETEDRRSTQIVNKKLDGYLWTVSDGRTAFCSTCGTVRTTYGEIQGDEVLTCCPKCQRILSRDAVPADNCSEAAEHNQCDAVIDTSGDYNQDAQHVHIPASLCSVPDCKEWPTVAGRGAEIWAAHGGERRVERHVSPAINEFRIQQLKQLREENRVLRERIAGFERMNERLSNAVDEWLTDATSEHKAAA